MAFLDLSGVSKKYYAQSKNAVDDISFSLEKGEVLSVVGENGSGKSTLLKLIYGLEDTDTGDVVFKGKKVTGPSDNLVPGHKEMKFVQQDLDLFIKHSVKENIIYDLRPFTGEFQEARLRQLLELFKLEGTEGKTPLELSGGQQQRVALAKALAGQSELLLMDEPFSNLDVMLREEIKRKVIRTAKKEGSTLIFVTHDVSDALALSDKIAVLRDGKVLQIGTPQEVYERPKDEYVAFLFGHVNILPLGKILQVFPGLAHHKKLENLEKDVPVSFRPEHVSICKEEKMMAKVRVKDITYLGAAWELEAEVKGVSFKIKSRKKYEIGEAIFVRILPSKIHQLGH
jgi:ABC-type Fe3+/spermidine/putrescine transport system ATPase subunit